jgi:DNA-binding transcriptional LysR family regulator
MKHMRSLTSIAEVAKCGSIRRAAERLNITPSALTRQIQDLEHELGTPLFERLASGMRLNAAGELLVRHIKDQIADLERVRSQIADLSGVRRGHVTLACSQAFVTKLIPEEIETYRSQFPEVRFAVKVRDHALGVAALDAMDADLALLLQPPHSAELQVLQICRTQLCALMRATHPLSRERGPVRLRDCLAYPTALPDHTLATRHHIEQSLARRGMPLEPTIESGSIEFLRNVVLRENALSLQSPSGIPDDPNLVTRPIDARDLPLMTLLLAQKRGRVLSIAAAKFAHQLMQRLQNDPTVVADS